ncbi:MAG: GyrI-like domain-containing protein [Chitinophagaceae bacterium]
MDIQINNQPLVLDIYGFGGTATNNDYASTAFKLSGRMWEIIKSNGIKNKGKNIWVYEGTHKVFTGVEMEDASYTNNHGLEKMTIHLEKYAYYKHIGSYELIKQSGQSMTKELMQKGYEIVFPYIEIYGHWIKDESKLETELLMSIK